MEHKSCGKHVRLAFGKANLNQILQQQLRPKMEVDFSVRLNCLSRNISTSLRKKLSGRGI